MQLAVEDLETYAPVSLYSPGMTEEAFLAFCERFPDYQIEYTSEGDIIIMPPTDSNTGFRNGEIMRQLGNWAAMDGGGRAFDSSTGFFLPSGARRSPDAAWASHSILASVRGSKLRFPVLCPEFVIVLKSPSDRRKKLRDKMIEWIEGGSLLGWLIDPEHRTVTIYRPNQDPEVLRNPSSVNGEGPVEGFVLDLTPIWGEI